MGQQTPICSFATGPSTTTGVTAYQPLCIAHIGSVWDTTEANVKQPFPCAGTIDYLLIKADNAPTASGSYAFTIRKNAADTALTASLAGSNTTTSDTYDSFTVAAGDLLDIKCVTSGTPVGTTTIRWQVRFTSNITNQSIVLSGVVGSKLSGGLVPAYATAQGAGLTNIEEISAQALMPTAGTFKNLYVSLSNAVTSGHWTVTVDKNSSPQTLTATISSGTTGNDTTHSFSVVAGDIISVSVSSAFGTGPSSYILLGVEFDPTIDGESLGLIASGTNGMPAASSDYYPVGGSDGYQTPIGNSYDISVMSVSVKKLITLVSGGLSSGRVIQSIRVNSTLTTVQTSVGSFTNPNQDTIHSYTTADFDLIDIATTTPSSVPPSIILAGFVFYFSPHALNGGAGAFVFSGKNATMTVHPSRINGQTGVFLFTGNPALMNQIPHRINGRTGVFLFTGNNATLTATSPTVPISYPFTNARYTVPPAIVQPELTPGGQITQTPYYQAEAQLRTRNVPLNAMRVISGSQQWVQGDYKIEFDTTTNSVDYYLPTYANFIGTLTLTWISGANAATVVATNMETISGSAVYLLTPLWKSITITAGTTGWVIVSSS